jgi:hypothetical protein
MAYPVGADLGSEISRVVVSHDGDDWVLGRPDLGIYVSVPEPGAVIVEALQAGASLPVATERASAAAGADVDGAAFLGGLAAAGLLGSPDGAGGGASVEVTRGREIRWIEGVSQATARRLCGPVAWTVNGLAAAFVLLAMIVRPDLRPSFEHYWWLPDPVLSLLTLAAFLSVAAGAHELWHWLAARAIGVPAVFRVSYRGIYLVFETDVTQIVAQPRHRRYPVFLAGMALDVTVLAAALAPRLAHRVDLVTLPGWLDRFLGGVGLVLVTGIIWQWAALIARSDGYAILANALRCHDLYRATWLTTKERLWRLTADEAAELASASPHDRRVARVFGLAHLVGLTVMAWMLLAFGIPFLLSMLWWVGDNLAHPSPTSVAFWESAAVTTLLVGQYAALPLLAARERRMRKRGALR